VDIALDNKDDFTVHRVGNDAYVSLESEPAMHPQVAGFAERLYSSDVAGIKLDALVDSLTPMSLEKKGVTPESAPSVHQLMGG